MGREKKYLEHPRRWRVSHLGRVSHQVPLVGEIRSRERKAAHQTERFFSKEGVGPGYRRRVHHSHGVCRGKGKQYRSLLGSRTPILPSSRRDGSEVHPKSHTWMGTDTFSKWKHGGSMPVNHSRHRQKKGRKKAASLTSCLTEMAVKDQPLISSARACAAAKCPCHSL